MARGAWLNPASSWRPQGHSETVLSACGSRNATTDTHLTMGIRETASTEHYPAKHGLVCWRQNIMSLEQITIDFCLMPMTMAHPEESCLNASIVHHEKSCTHDTGCDACRRSPPEGRHRILAVRASRTAAGACVTATRVFSPQRSHALRGVVH